MVTDFEQFKINIGNPDLVDSTFEKITKNMERWGKECSSEEQVSKLIDKISNKDLDGFERVKSWLFLSYFAYANHINESNFFTEQIRTKLKRSEKWTKEKGIILSGEEKLYLMSSSSEIGQMDLFLREGKIFSIDSKIVELLKQTKIDYDYSDSPYPNILIPFRDFIVEPVEILGILIRDKAVAANRPSKEKLDGRVADIVVFCRDNRDGELAWLYTSIYSNKSLQRINDIPTDGHDKIWCGRETFEILDELVKRIACNFLNLINHPEVEIINHSMAKLRELREKSNKVGIPDKCEINIKGKLKKYITETTEQNEKAWELGHRFWVRGHWMNFKNECYKEKRGQKTWVLPYIKGKGELVNKNYYLGVKKQQWENERRMIELVTSIFPNKDIEKHNRTQLEGLEIDCYLPEYKLGFEYNGLQHYQWVEVFHKTEEEFKAQQLRDIKKNQIASEKGIKIVTIRYDELLTKDLIEGKIKEVYDDKTN